MTQQIDANQAQKNADTPDWGMFYQEHSKDLSKRKSIKVKLPLRQHVKLHALKLFTENNISETVEMALDDFFERLKEEENEAAAAAEAAAGEHASQSGEAQTA